MLKVQSKGKYFILQKSLFKSAVHSFFLFVAISVQNLQLQSLEELST